MGHIKPIKPIGRRLVTPGGRALLAGAGTSYDPSAVALFNAMTTPPTAARKKLISDTYIGMKASGAYDQLECLWVSAAADSQAARLNWISPAAFMLSAVNAPAFTADRGFTGDGSSSYLDTGFIPSLNATKWTLNNAHVGAWRVAGTNTSAALLSVAGAGASALIQPRNSTPATATRINSGGLSAAASNPVLGHVVASRLVAATSSQYLNGAQNATGSDTANSLENRSIVLLRANTSYSNDQIGIAHFGAGLTGAQEAALYNVLLTYMQAVGAA